MTTTLPSAIGKICRMVALLGAWAACHHDQPPVAPGEPIPAAADIQVESMDIECNHLVDSILKFGACPNSDENDQAWAKNLAEVAQQSFDAGKKGNPDEPSQHVIALACHKAAESVKHATERCVNGPRPKGDY
jgi:hypothetical protein